MSRAMYVSRPSPWGRDVVDRTRPSVTAPRTAVVAGVGFALFAVTEALVRAEVSDTATRLTLIASLLALCTTLPLSFAGTDGAAAMVAASSVVSLTFFHSLTVAGSIVQLIVLYRLGRAGSRVVDSQVAATVLAMPFLVLALVGDRAVTSEAALLTILLAALAPACAWSGIARRWRVEVLVHSTAREMIAGDLVEHTARGERARIARELHDVVAHHISMVAVQAETARLTTVGMPAAGAERLLAIGDTARAALTEMRRLLGVLREDARADDAERRPQPGLSQLNDLLDETRDATGTGARLILRGAPAPLDPGVELAAYRIAQEALTNARRHAAGAAVDVELHYTDHALFLRIRDNGPGPSADTRYSGHGLPGMSERAAAVGGSLTTGPASGGGFVVEALLPVTVDEDP